MPTTHGKPGACCVATTPASHAGRGYAATLVGVSGRHVRPGRWSRLEVEVRADSDVRGFSIGGGGRGVEVRPKEFGRSLPPGSVATVHVRALLKRDHPRRIDLYLQTYGSAFGPVDRLRTRLVPRRH